MQSLDEKTWDAIELDSMFTFERGKEKNMASLTQGHIPLVSARKVNNGIKGFVDNPAKVIKGGNVISLNNDGDGGAGLAYYQPVDFALDTHVTALHPQKVISSDALLCMTASISKQHAVFGHGRSISLPRAHRIQNMLPVTDSGEPDYEYMAEYARQKGNAMLAKYRAYVEERIAELGEVTEIPALDEKKWKPFSIVDLFSSIIPGKGKGLNHLKKVCADGVNYIGATNRNNGVLCYVEEDTYSRPMILEGNCIGFIKNGDGSAGFAIYKAEQFISTNDVLYGYADWLNKFTGLFFVVAQDKIEHKYSHGYKRNKEHLAGDKVMLPVTDSGEPDYEYIEQYSKNMILRKYQQYLTFAQQRSDA